MNKAQSSLYCPQGTTKKIQSDEEYFCLSVTIRLVNTHTHLFSFYWVTGIVKPRWFMIDLPRVLPLPEKSTEVTAMTHTFPKQYLQSWPRWLNFTVVGSWKRKVPSLVSLLRKKWRCWYKSAPKPQCTMTSEVRALCMPHGAYLRPSFSVHLHLLLQSQAKRASSASLLKAGRDGMLCNAEAAWLLLSLSVVSAY